MPLASVETTSAFRFIIAARSNDTPITFTPCVANSCWAISSLWLDSSSAFDGMQPTRRHVPPSCGSFSTTAAFIPSCAARIAAT